MESLHTTGFAVYFLQISISIFLAILFLQSGIDKIVDRRGNLEWLTGHFAKSPLAALVPLLLLTITGLELAAGVLSAMGAVQLLLTTPHTVAVALRVTTAGIQLLLARAVVCACVARAVKVDWYRNAARAPSSAAFCNPMRNANSIP